MKRTASGYEALRECIRNVTEVYASLAAWLRMPVRMRCQVIGDTVTWYFVFLRYRVICVRPALVRLALARRQLEGFAGRACTIDMQRLKTCMDRRHADICFSSPLCCIFILLASSYSLLQVPLAACLCFWLTKVHVLFLHRCRCSWCL